MDSQVFERFKSPQKQEVYKSTFADDRHQLFSLTNADIFIHDRKVLSQVNFKLFQGEFVFVTGATGAGKSTLLNIIASENNLYKITGKVERRGFSGKRKLFTSQIFQDLKIFKNKSIAHNLQFSFDEKIYSSREAFEREVFDYLRVFGISSFQHSLVQNTNGGVHQKVAIIRALLTKPDVIIADEPTSSLDKKSSMLVFDVLNHLNAKQKVSIVWATHDRDLIRNLHGRVIHIDSGKIMYSGKACFI